MSCTLSETLRPFLLRALTKLLFFCLLIVLFLSKLKGGKKAIDKQQIFFNLFYFYIYSLDSQESDGGASKVITPTCFRKCQDIAVCLKFNKDTTLVFIIL